MRVTSESRQSAKTKKEPAITLALLNACFHKLLSGGLCRARTYDPLIKSFIVYIKHVGFAEFLRPLRQSTTNKNRLFPAFGFIAHVRVTSEQAYS